MSKTHIQVRRSNRPEPLLQVLIVCWFGLSAAVAHCVNAQKPTPPKLKQAAAPNYPDEARSHMIVGDVVFRAQINEKGTVDEVQVLKVPEKNLGFEQAVKQTVMQWKFEPSTLEGKPVTGTYVGKIGFSLRPDEEKAIRDFVNKAIGAWNKGDAKKLASHLDQKEGRLQERDELARNSKDARNWISSQLSGNYRKSEVKVSLDRIQFFPVGDLARITPSFSLVPAGGQGQDPVQGQLSVLLQKADGRWCALSGQLIRQRGSRELVPPTKVKHAEPNYPSKAKKEHIQGTVVLEGTVGLNGKLSDITVVRSIPELDQAAINAVKQWEYEPATLNGQATPMVTTVTVNFLLQ